MWSNHQRLSRLNTGYVSDDPRWSVVSTQNSTINVSYPGVDLRQTFSDLGRLLLWARSSRSPQMKGTFNACVEPSVSPAKIALEPSVEIFCNRAVDSISTNEVFSENQDKQVLC